MSNNIQTSTSSESKLTEADYLSFGLLREIRAAAQHLQKVFEETVGLASKLDAPGRKALMERALGIGMQARINWTISRNLERFEKLFTDNCIQRDWCSDSIEIIRLNWLQVTDVWPNAALTYDQQRQAAEQAQVCLDRIIFECASLTLSPRVNDMLENLRVGQPLDWDFRFGSELPKDEELRKRLLLEMAQEAGVLQSAIVDVDQRVIYKVAQSRSDQRWSAWKLAGFVVIGAIIVPLALAWIGKLLNGWPLRPEDLTRLYATYVLMFLGAGTHVAIDALKAARAQTRPNFQAINDWVIWLHIRYYSILWSLAWVLLGYIILSLAMPTMAWQSAFFVGYSIDSVLGLFLARFEATVKVKTQGLMGVATKA